MLQMSCVSNAVLPAQLTQVVEQTPCLLSRILLLCKRIIMLKHDTGRVGAHNCCTGFTNYPLRSGSENCCCAI